MKTLIDDGYFFEGPRWHDGAWWCSDIYAKQVLRITPDGTKTVMAEVEGEPSGLGWLPDGDLLIASMHDRKLLRRRPNGDLVVHADLSGHIPFFINDMVVDAHGRAYVGNFGFDIWNGAEPQSTFLTRVDPDGSVHREGEGLWFPNGNVISGDGKTLIVAESGAARLTAFTIGKNGSLSDQRIWAQLGESRSLASASDLAGLSFGPDGCAIDSLDRVWVADAMGNRVCCVAEGGEILETVSTVDLGVYACALGGEDGHSLMMCAAPDFHADKRKAKREACLLVTMVDATAQAF
jgi:sugar lactone lactonase YvrE